jgi:methylglutaconyl-CoA hydratase
MTNSIIVTHKKNAIDITLNRPTVRNALNKKLIIELTKTLKKADNDKSVRVICLQGAGEIFSAGGDLTWMQQAANLPRQQNINDAKQFSILLEALAHLRKPSIAIVQGGAFGGAVGLLACCDIVIAENNARFAFTETRIGLVPSIISPYVIQAIGERQARRYFLTAEFFSSSEAQLMGLVHHSVAKRNLTATKVKIIEQLLQNSPYALMQVKKLFQPIDTKKINQTIALLADVRNSKEAREGMTAFLQKRKPYWQR